jgi:4a-hydroxytetrahydrobiopterin dehydratase
VDTRLTRREASDAAGGHGWRYLLGTLRTAVRVTAMAQAAEVAALAVAACGADADRHLRADLRHDRVLLTLQPRGVTMVTARDAELAGAVSAALRAAGLAPDPGTGPDGRPVQILEIAIDALDIAAVRPFWKAILGYADETDTDGPTSPIVDPTWQSPAIWFQQMRQPRPQRNRIHFDICVPHDDAARRIEAALAAGGRLVSADRAPAFWVLADVEGNEACVTTWQGRDG